jgi:hypothetical protein
VESSCERGNETSGAIKCWEIPSGGTTGGLWSGTQLHRVRLGPVTTEGNIHSLWYLGDWRLATGDAVSSCAVPSETALHGLSHRPVPTGDSLPEQHSRSACTWPYLVSEQPTSLSAATFSLSARLYFLPSFISLRASPLLVSFYVFVASLCHSPSAFPSLYSHVQTCPSHTYRTAPHSRLGSEKPRVRLLLSPVAWACPHDVRS